MSEPRALVEHFFRHEFGRLCAVLTRSLGVRRLELVEDVVQAALVRALETWSRRGVPEDPAGWLYRTARNLAIDALRRERHPSELMPDPAQEPEAPIQADRVLAMAQQESRIRSALSLLPAEQADVIRKAFFEDKVHAEIEKELGIPLGTVKSRLRLAINRLRAVLGDLG